MKRQIPNRYLAALGVAALAIAASIGGCNLDKQQAAFLARIGKTSITVFPAAVRRSAVTYDDGASAKLADFLNKSGLADAKASNRHVQITGPWRHNQARMLKESAKEFGEYVRANTIETQYALLPEYLGGRTEAGGIHAYIVDAQGTVVFQVLLNSHWPEFAKVKPKTEDECTTVLIDVLRDRLKTHTSQKP